MKNIFKGKKVVIMGLGLHGGGASAARFFVRQKAKVLITDLKTKNQLKESIDKLKGLPVKYVLGKHKREDFKNADIIIKNPDVPNNSPYLKIAARNHIPIETDVALFFKYSNAQIIGITGTKGKTTVALLVYDILKEKYKSVFLAGNVGVSPLELLGKTGKDSIVVLELSSFELENLTSSPQVAVITNIMKDHLNRYKGMSEYIEAKKPIFRYQSAKDCLVLNYDDRIVKSFARNAKSKVYFYSLKKRLNNSGCYLKGRDIFCGNRKRKALDLDDYNLFGEHNIYNLLAAATTAKVAGVPHDLVKKAVKKFKGVPSRQEFIAEIKGVKYFNDTTATMPDAVIEAIKTFKNRFPSSKLIFICGGQDKNLDFKKMALEVKRNVDKLILLPGTGSLKLIKNLGSGYKLFHAFSMGEAVKRARVSATEGDIVVLCPGAASFNLFKNEFDRGDKFVASVNSLKKNGK